MQFFEPNGVFARNLKECLKIQLINENNFDSKKEILIDNIDLLEVEILRSSKTYRIKRRKTQRRN